MFWIKPFLKEIHMSWKLMKQLFLARDSFVGKLDVKFLEKILLLQITWRSVLFVVCCCSVTKWYPPFSTTWTAERQASLSSTITQSLLKLIFIESVMPSNHLILCCPLLLLTSNFPTFLKSWLLASAGQSIGISASASVLSMNIQDWFPLGLTGLISLLSKGLSGVFSSTTVQSISSSTLSLLYGPTLTSVHDYWKNHSFDYMDLCRQNDVSAF